MIVYSGTKTDFLSAVEADSIAEEIEKTSIKKCIAVQEKVNFVPGKILWNICIRS